MDDMYGEMEDGLPPHMAQRDTGPSAEEIAMAEEWHERQQRQERGGAAVHNANMRRGALPRDIGSILSDAIDINMFGDDGDEHDGGFNPEAAAADRRSTFGVLPNARLGISRPRKRKKGGGDDDDEIDEATRAALHAAGLDSTSSSSGSDGASSSSSSSSDGAKRRRGAEPVDIMALLDEGGEAGGRRAADAAGDAPDEGLAGAHNPQCVTYALVSENDDDDDDDDGGEEEDGGGSGGSGAPPRRGATGGRGGPLVPRGVDSNAPAGLLPERCYGCMWGDWEMDKVQSIDAATFSNLIEKYIFRIPREQLAFLMHDKYKKMRDKHPKLPPWSYDGIYAHLRMHLQSDPRVIIYEIIHEGLIPNIREMFGKLFDGATRTPNKVAATILKDLLTQLKAWLLCDFTKMVGYNPGFALDIKSMSAAVQDPGYKVRDEGEERVMGADERFVDDAAGGGGRSMASCGASALASQADGMMDFMEGLV